MVNRRYLQTPEAIRDLLGIPFSDEQMAVIQAPLEPAVIIAGAGTGKTTVMAARVVWLIASGQVTPDQVLGLTFTKKATAELDQRIHTALITSGVISEADLDRYGRVQVNTYDAFAGSILRRFGLLAGIETDQKLISDATRFRLAEQAICTWDQPLRYLHETRVADLVRAVVEMDSALSSHLLSVDDLVQHDQAMAQSLGEVKLYRGKVTRAVAECVSTIDKRHELMIFVQRYRDLKAQHGVGEFADQMMQATILAEKCDVSALRTQFRVVLLDEYQDTSIAQARLLKALFSGSSPDTGLGHAVNAVGDPFQSIYGWRGAAPGNILQFSTDFPLTDGSPSPRYALLTNRRSKSAIVDIANRMLDRLKADIAAIKPQVDTSALVLDVPPRTASGELYTAVFNNPVEQGTWIAQRIIDLKESGQCEWSDCGILVRDNGQIGPIYEALRALDVPVELRGLGGLLDLPMNREIISTLSLIDDITSDDDILALLTGPRWRIGTGDLDALGSYHRRLNRELRERLDPDEGSETRNRDVDDHQLCLMDAILAVQDSSISDDAKDRLAQFCREIIYLRTFADEPIVTLIYRVIDQLGLRLFLESDPIRHARGDWEQVRAFVDAAASYSQLDDSNRLAGFLAWVNTEREFGDGLKRAMPSGENAVTLLTIHQAKGLEWENVFLPGVYDGRFPVTRTRSNWLTRMSVLPFPIRGDADWLPQLDDELTSKMLTDYPKRLRQWEVEGDNRLAYVAYTRARSQLYISYSLVDKNRPNRRRSPYFDLVSDHPDTTMTHQVIDPSCDDSDTVDGLRAVPWPLPLDADDYERRLEAADQVRSFIGSDVCEEPGLEPQAQAFVRTAFAQAQELIEQRRARYHAPQVTIPPNITPTGLMKAFTDPEAYRRSLIRPMPRPVNKATGLGSRFHAWIERYFQHPGNPSLDEEFVADDATPYDLDHLVNCFLKGRFAHLKPVAIEESFDLLIGGQVISGRIDAVFDCPDDPEFDYRIVDWKTSTKPQDPIQLSLYRMAWARTNDLSLDRVDAIFYHVLTDECERPPLLSAQQLAHQLDEVLGTVRSERT